MKTSKFLILGILAVSLSFTTSALGQCIARVSCGVDAYFMVPLPADGEAADCVLNGQELYYVLTPNLDSQACPLINGVVTVTLPDGRVFQLDDDASIPLAGLGLRYDIREWIPGYGDTVPAYVFNCDDPPAQGQILGTSVREDGSLEEGTLGAGQESLTCALPCIEVTKTVDPELSKPGDTVTYTICVTNCTLDPECPVTLYNVLVEDPLLGGVLNADGTNFPLDFTLPPGTTVCQDFDYVVQEEDPDPLENCVTASGEDEAGNRVEDEDCAVVELFQPCVEVSKDCDEVSKVGDIVTYTITLTNCSSPDTPELEAVAVDSLLGVIFEGILPPGDTVIVLEREVLETDPDPLINTVTLIASPIDFDNIIEADPATCETDLVHPDFTVQKNCSSDAVVGQTIDYDIMITNTGDVALLILSVDDSIVGPIPGCAGIILAPFGDFCIDTYSYTVLPSDLPGPIVNTVTVTVVVDQLPNILERKANCTTNIFSPDSKVTIVASDTTVCEGESVTLTICEENTGLVDLTAVSVDVSTGDTLEYPPDTDNGNGDDILNPGEKWCWDITVTPSMTTIYSATGQGTDPAGNIITYPDYPSEYAETTINTEECGGEGCTPGFWKNNGDKHGASAWDCFSPSTRFGDVFLLNDPLVIRGKGKNTITNPTLLQALGANGGGVNAMIRHGVAALLNACSDCVQYATNDPIGIIIMIEDTLNGEPGAHTVGELHTMFAGYNEAGCPVNQHGICVGVEED
ncbi:hypothetical protein ACFL3Q_02955 [Planctomycetota bacterium]